VARGAIPYASILPFLQIQALLNLTDFWFVLFCQESGVLSNEEETQGENIEDVEFNREEDSSDIENFQDRQLLDDSSQPPIAPVSEYARMDAELGQSESESDVRLPGGRKRAKRVESDQIGVLQSR
jgi:hypothetical protein